MELIDEMTLSQWGFGLYGYLGDVFIPYRTLILAGLVVVALKVRKTIKARKAGN